MKSWQLPINLWQRLEVLPPCAVRLLAKKGNALPLNEQAMSDEEISAASGLPPATVRLVSFRLDWIGVDIPVARAFMQACGVDVTSEADMRRVRNYMSGRPKWKYLRHSPHYPTTFKPLMKMYAGLR